jgi:hypothetical protein
VTPRSRLFPPRACVRRISFGLSFPSESPHSRCPHCSFARVGVNAVRCAQDLPATPSHSHRTEPANRPSVTTNHLRRPSGIRHCRTFELPKGKESPQKHVQPFPNIGQFVVVSLIGRQTRRPIARRIFFPGMHRQEGDLRRAEAEPQSVEQIEILQCKGADCDFRALRLLTFAHRYQFRRNLRRKDCTQCLRDVIAELPRRDDPPDQVLDQCLRNTGVYVVVGHLVPYPVGAPSERQFRKIARPNYDPSMMVGQSEQMSVRNPACTFSNVTS